MRTVRLPTVSCGIQGVEVGTHPLQVSCLGVGWVPIPGHTHPPPRHTHDSQKRSWDQRYPTPPPDRTWDQGPGRHLALLLLALNIIIIQWRILEFPEGRAPTQRWGRNILFWQFFPDNCMKLKKKLDQAP